MGAFVPASATLPATTTIGLPMARTAGPGTVNPTQSESRPIQLNRPFRSVGELSCVYTGTPWKNLSFSTPESGFSALLDLFCIQESERLDSVVAGKVNLNVAPFEVIKALFTGAHKDMLNLSPTALNPPITPTEAKSLADLWMKRVADPSTSKGPLKNIADLVGRWTQSASLSQGGIDGAKSYEGFSSDLGTVFASNPTMNNIQRFREAPIRALADVGSVRVWNVMIDLVVQSGQYPEKAKELANFAVEAEQHYWIHLAIDRFTGKVISRQCELVRE